MIRRYWFVAVPLLAAAPVFAGKAGPTCADVLARIGPVLADVKCVDSPDLTTNGGATTTWKNNALTPPLPLFAFTPETDRATIAPVPPPTPTRVVAGIQIDARIADDPTGEARFLLRLPNDWNGRLVVAGASGNRSEFNGDFVWSDYVVQKGYAYASQNKGILNLQFTSAADPQGCRLNPASPLWVRFFNNERNADGSLKKPFTEWQFRIQEAAVIAKEGVKGGYGKFPKHTYVVGTSNGGYQVRRAIEEAPELFDGGIDWEGTFVDSSRHNLLATLPIAVTKFAEYRDDPVHPYDPNSSAARAMLAAGYPPDIVVRDATGKVTDSLWKRNNDSFWEVTFCQWQKNLDPSYKTYQTTPNETKAGAANYHYAARAHDVPSIRRNLDAFATTGEIERPIITVAGTMDALLPIQHHARVYASRVAAHHEGEDDEGEAAYRLYEVQNGNHIESYKPALPGIELITPHAQKSFDLLVDYVEHHKRLPPGQCIARGGAIAPNPAQRGSCKQLFVSTP